MVEVVAFTGTLTHAGEHRQAAVLLGDVVDQFHHVDGLAHAGAAEQADLTALGERADQVNNLDAGFQQFHRRRQFVETGSRLVNATLLVVLDRASFVDGTAQHVHDAAERAGADGHRDRGARAGDFHAATQTVAGAQRNGTHHAVAQLLLHFQRQTLFGERGTLVGQSKRFVDLGHLIAGELNIHHGADALNDGSVAHVDSLLDSF